jgi:phage terminase small subunit
MDRGMMLTPQQEKFAQAVAGGKSQAEAYREAYPKSKNWKDAAVHTNASKLMSDTKVLLRVEELRKAASDIANVSSARVLQEIARIALFDPRKLFFDDGTPKPITSLDDDTAAALAGLDVTEEFEGSGEDRKFVGYTKKYKIADKNTALEKLAKHLGLYEKDNTQKTSPLTDLYRAISNTPLPVVANPVADDDDE